MSTVLKLISWKHSFNRLNEEYEIAKKKKQALDNLYETGRISQATRDSFNDDINAAITEIEKQQKDLLAKMQIKTQELMDQIKTLETLLANYEIQHVVGEIDEEIYQREINLLSTGLETTKHDLDTIKGATTQLCPPAVAPAAEPPAPPQEAEVVQNEPVENVPAAPAEVEVAVESAPQEPVIAVENAPEQLSTESADATPPPEAPVEAPQPTEETAQEAAQEIQEPVVTVEPAPEQLSTENAGASPTETLTEAPQPVEEIPKEATEENQASVIAVEAVPEISPTENAEIAPPEAPQEAHPQEAPKEAPQETIVEPISEKAQPAEKTAATETKPENTENQQS